MINRGSLHTSHTTHQCLNYKQGFRDVYVLKETVAARIISNQLLLNPCVPRWTLLSQITQGFFLSALSGLNGAAIGIIGRQNAILSVSIRQQVLYKECGDDDDSLRTLFKINWTYIIFTNRIYSGIDGRRKHLKQWPGYDVW